MSLQWVLRCGAFAAFAAAFLLAYQVFIALPIGDAIALLGSSLNVARMQSFFETNAPSLRQLFAADNSFAIAYAVAFVALGVYLLPRTRALVGIALGLALVTAFLDLAENSLTLAGVETVSQNQTLESGTLVTLFWLGQMKYLTIYLGGILFAIALWDGGILGNILAGLLFSFAVVGIAAIAIPTLEPLKILWMFALLVAGGVFMARQATDDGRRTTDSGRTEH